MKSFAVCIFIVTNQNKAKHEYFLFQRQITVYWQRIDFNSVWSRKDKNQNFENNNFILLPNILPILLLRKKQSFIDKRTDEICNHREIQILNSNLKMSTNETR